MEVIFILGASQAFFLSFLVFAKREKSHGDYVLTAWLGFMGLHLLNHYIISTGIAYEYPHLLGLGACFPMLEGPFMFVYILTMISRSGKLKPAYLLHAAPFVLFTIYFLFDFYLLGAEEKLAYYRVLEIEPTIPLLITELLNNLLGPFYVIWSLIKLRKHIKNISNRFSYTEEINLAWLKYVLIGLGFVWSVVLLTNVLDLFTSDTDIGTHLIYLSLTIAVFFLGYFGIKQKAIYVQSSSPEPRDIEEDKSQTENEVISRYKNSGLKDQVAKKYLEELLNYMNSEKPYLNGKLSLKDVAEHLGISVNHLSQVINEQLDKSFFDFVNSYRVEEVKKHVAESKHEQLTLLAIAYESGFNSKSSFNSIFKRLTGVTPSQYVQSQAA